jgi:hypothetical protein
MQEAHDERDKKESTLVSMAFLGYLGAFVLDFAGHRAPGSCNPGIGFDGRRGLGIADHHWSYRWHPSFHNRIAASITGSFLETIYSGCLRRIGLFCYPILFHSNNFDGMILRY